MEEIIECPNCHQGVFNPFLKCRDYTVSKEIFSIKACSNCGFTLTSPRPTFNEIGRYYESEDYVSHSNTNKGFINKIYHFVKKRAIKKKIGLIEDLNPKFRNILDIGAGTGTFLNEIQLAGWNTKGVEPNKKARDLANALNLDVFEDSKGLQNDSFGVITMWHVLEHVHELNDQIAIIYNLLQKEGFVVIAVPNFTSWDAKHYNELWAAYDVPRHLYHFSPKIIKELFHKASLKFIKSMPMKMDSYYVSMLSEKYKGGSLQLPKAFLSGLISNLKAGGDAEKFSSVIYIFQK